MPSILYRLFKLGALPPDLRRELDSEGIRLLEEGIPLTVTYRDVRGPGRYHSFKRSWSLGAIALTHQRIVVSAYRSVILNLTLGDPHFSLVEWSLGGEGELWASFDAALTDTAWTGRLEIAVRSSQASRAFAMLERELAHPG